VAQIRAQAGRSLLRWHLYQDEALEEEAAQGSGLHLEQ
jgi:hypothetical protein